MGSKIVSIFMTIFMLTMCMLALLTLNITNLSKSNDLDLARASSSVISTNGEITKDSEVILRGSSLISSVIGADIIDSRLDNENKIYTTGDYNGASGVITPRKVYRYQGVISSSSEVLSAIDPMGYYSIKYTDNASDSTNILVEIQRVNIET